MPGSYTLGLRRKKVQLDPTVWQHLGGWRFFNMGKGIRRVVGDQLPIKSQSAGIERLILQKTFGNIHKNLLFQCEKRFRLFIDSLS